MFEVSYENEGGARTGVLETAHGRVETPLFMPVATQGTVKTLTFDRVEELGFEAVISNALVLYLRPGLERIEKAGGLHGFMGWQRTVFTDSGGFQMLNPDFIDKKSEKGVTFRSPFDGSRHLLTPERCIEIQNELGSDVAMVLDTLIPFGSDNTMQEKAVETTSKWARRCKDAHKNDKQLLFAITQGGIFPGLRMRSAKELVGMGFDGYAIGGLSIGEPKDVMHQILKEQTALLPSDKPRYLMGVGSPAELLQSISAGVDIFDSTFPTRNARHNDAYTFTGEMNLSRGRYRDDTGPIEEGCRCYACLHHSRAYVHHLLRNHEVSGQSLMTIHNLFFIQRLLKDVKEAIKEGRFNEFRTEALRRLKSKSAVGRQGV